MFKKSFKKIKKFKINRQRITIPVAVLLLVGLSSSYFFFFHSKPASAAWWNDSWQYRKSIAVTNSTSEESNVYIAATVDTSDTTRFKTNCGDLRFTKLNGELLPYYIVSGCGSASTVVDVNFDAFPAGAQTIYYYYGNPNAANGFSAADFSTVASNYTVGSIGSEEKGTGPAAYWSFDDGQGATANDGTANKNNGTLTNMSATASSTSGWQTEDACVSGKCLAFDGGNDWVISNSSITIGTSDFTVQAWVNSLADSTAIIGTVSGGAGSGFMLYTTYGTSGVYFSTRDGLTTTASSSGATSISDGKWHQVVGVRSSTYLYIYVDGSLYASSNVGSVLDIGSGDNSPRIGAMRVNAPPDIQHPFRGKIDEPKIYSYARTAAQIKLDYNVGLAGQGGAAAEGSAVSAGGRSQKWLSDGLVGYWKMDEASWNGTAGEVVDWSGNENNGTAAGNASTTAGKFGNGGIFDGTGDYVFTPSTYAIGSTVTPISYSTWIKRSGTCDNWNVLISHAADGNSGPAFLCGLSGHVNELTIYSGSAYFYSGYTIGTDWTMVSMIFDGSIIKMYANGSLVYTTSATTISAGTTRFTIGGRWGVGDDNYFNGKIDETRVYNRALSDREVRDLYAWAPGPVAYYNFEEGSGGSVYDTSGNNNLGTWSGTGSHWTQGKFGKGGSFNGTDDYAATASRPITGTSNFTINGWVKFGSLSSAYSVPIWNGIDDTTAGFGLGYRKANSRVLYAGWGSSTGEVTGLTSTDNTWYYVASTYDGSSHKFYINGVLQNSANYSSSNFSGGVMTFGNLTSAVGYWFNGQIDDVRIYNYARTSKQIVEDMNAGSPGSAASAKATASQSTVGYWKFDEGYGTTQYDSSSQKNNATSTGAAWTNNGKYGKALSFDGTDDYASAADISTLDGASQFSISTWVYINSMPVDHGGIVTKRVAASITDGISFGIYGPSAYPELAVRNTGNTFAYAGNNTVTTGVWTHLIAVYDGNQSANTDKIKIYKNGVLLSAAPSGTIPSTTSSNSASVIFGCDPEVGACPSPGDMFPGLIDEVKIYNYALTQDEVAVDYNHGKSLSLGSFSQSSAGVASSSSASAYCVPGSTDTCSAPIGEWKFEEGSGGSAQDTSGNGNTGTWAGTGSHWTQGKVGKAGNFNGVDDRVSISSSDAFTFKTISLWAKIQSGALLSSYDHWVDNQDYALYYSAGNLILSRNDYPPYDILSAPVNLNEWTHIEIIVAANQQQILYINGAPKATFNGVTTDVHRLQLGLNHVGANFFKGQIDDVRVYNYVRTAAQIAWDYNKGKPAGWWKMDEGQGTTVYDSSGNGNNGANSSVRLNSPTAGMLSQSGLSAFVAGFVTDSDTTNNAWHTDSAVPGAYMLMDAGSGQTKDYVKSRIYDLTGGYAGNYSVQYSDDNSTWATAATNFIPGSAGWNEKTWASAGGHRYWRFYLTNTPGAGAWLNELEMYTNSYVAGKFNKALDFDGTDDYVSLGDPASGVLDFGTGDFTVSAWINTSKNSPANKEWPFISKTAGSGNNGFELETTSWGVSGNQIDFQCYFTVGGADYRNCGSFGILYNINQWYLITMKRVGTTVTLYLDGNQVSSTTHAELGINVSNSSDLRIGGQDIWSAGSLYQGQIDDVRVYNYALTPLQVKDIYNTGAVRFGQ